MPKAWKGRDNVKRCFCIIGLSLALLVAFSSQTLAGPYYGQSISLKTGMGAGVLGVEATTPLSDHVDAVTLLGFTDEAMSGSLGVRMYIKPDGFRPYLYLAAGVVISYYTDVIPVLLLASAGVEYLSPGGFRIALEGGMGLAAASGVVASSFGLGFSIGYRFS